MDMRSANNVDRAVFVAAFAERPKAAIRSLQVDDQDASVGRSVAVYSRSNRAGVLVGVITWPELVSVMAEANGNTFLDGGSMNEDDTGVFDTVGGGIDRGGERLQARRLELLAKLEEIDAKLANR